MKRATVQKVRGVTKDVNSIKGLSHLRDLSKLPTKSAKIRFLASQQMPTAEIAKTLDIRYQHVRNVLTTPLKSKQAA
jgi:hypothetical protein